MSSKLPMETERLIVREFAPGDREALLCFAREPEQLKYMLFSLSSEAEIDEFLTVAIAESTKQPRTNWYLAIEEKGRPGCVGSVDLMVEKEHPSSAELGYWLRKDVWGKGYATEASGLMLRLGFQEAKLHRIWGKCHEDNVPSAKVMEKLGMQKEGRIREHAWLRDHYRSSYLYSMLDREFQRMIGMKRLLGK